LDRHAWELELRRVSLRWGCWVSEWVPSTECGSEKAVMKWVGMMDRRQDKLMDERRIEMMNMTRDDAMDENSDG